MKQVRLILTNARVLSGCTPEEPSIFPYDAHDGRFCEIDRSHL